MAIRYIAAHFQPCTAGALLALLVVLSLAPAAAQDHSIHRDHAGHNAMSMAMDEQTLMDASQQARLLANKKESEFNHHLAGFFLILPAVFLLAHGSLANPPPFLRFPSPSCFLLSALFLLVFSDTELWPVGLQSWWYGLTRNHEDLQH